MAFTDPFFFLPVLVASYILSFALLWLWQFLTFASTIKNVPGPKSSSFIFGSLKEIWAEDNHSLVERWAEKYGRVVKYTALFGQERLSITDPKALNHILMHNHDYPKDDGYRWFLSRATGKGLLFVESDEHKRQRKVMTPAFGLSQVRELTEIFVQKGMELTDVLGEEYAKSPDEAKTINAVSWLNRTTLDVIGLAGFNYHFNSLRPNGRPNELSQVLAVLFAHSPVPATVMALKMLFPLLRWIPSSFRRLALVVNAQGAMNRIGQGILDESRSALLGTGEKGDGWRARDLLSLLVRANLATEERLRMTDSEVVSQIATFFVAGHETTANATAWALYSLCLNPNVQTRLRHELLQLESPTPTMDELNSLTYLDWFVKETLRYHSPVAVVTRCAAKDDVIPLSRPYTDTKGIVHDMISIQKGQNFDIPILAVNCDKELWGSDALEFKPERWEHPPETISSIPGVWSNLLSFLGGPRACIGYRFSIIEMKAILFCLVRAFEFTLAVLKEDIQRTRTLVQRPYVRKDERATGHESGLPLIIKRYRSDSGKS